ncbi:MAG: tetratricopeptide repeat protein [Candidatus Lambdaproteobacteria bacterium]|nr:tetratricopeptide repeat protein [Candidatus Lambdaproteobacteria bacterium]
MTFAEPTPASAAAEVSRETLLRDLAAHQREAQARPGDHLPPYHAGLILVQLGDHEAAIASYRQAIERDPSFSPAHYNLGTACAAERRWAEAEEAFLQAVRLAEDAEAWANLGAVYEAQDKLELAEDAFRKAVRLDPQERDARWRLGSIYLRLGQSDRAAQTFQDAVDVDESNVEAWNGLGLVAFHRGELDAARAYYLKAIALRDDHARAWNNLGNVYARQGNASAAEEAYAGAARRGPADPDIWFNLGEHFFRHDHPETERCLARVVELNRRDMEAWELLRQWYVRHPNPERWKSVLKILLAERPGELALLRELAHVLDRLGEHQEAAATLRRLIAREPHDEESRLVLAGLYVQQGQHQEAFQELSHVTIQRPEVIELWYRLGQRLLHHRQVESAIKCFLTVVAHSPQRTDCWLLLGELALEREQWELALERLKRAEELDRNNTALWLPLAERFIALGESGKAVQCLAMVHEHLRYLPQHWPRYYDLYTAAGRGEEFLALLERLLADQRLGRRYWINLAELYARAGQMERVQACLAQVAEGEGDAGSRDLLLGRYHLQRGEGQLALQFLRRVQAGHEQEPAYWMDRADAAYLVGDLEEAQAGYLRVLGFDAHNLRALFNLGNVLHRGKAYRDAERQFRAVLEIKPDEPKAWYNLALAQEEQGRSSLAREGFAKALQLDRRFAPAWNWQGILHVRAGRLPEARRAYLRCVAASGRTSANGWYNLGLLFRQQGEEQQAVACFQQAERLGGAKPAEGMASVRVFYDRDPSDPGTRA